MAAKGQYTTESQIAALQVRSMVLRRKILAWIDVQHLYVPTLRLLRARDKLPEGQVEELCESIKLYLPSTTPATLCDRRLLKIEWELRTAQANDSLDDLREALRLRSYLYIDKDRFQRGQRANTRSRSIIARVEAKVVASSTKYRAARQALLHLSTPLAKVGWQKLFPELRTIDIRGLKDSEEVVSGSTARISEGRRTLSWIWQQYSVDGANEATGNIDKGVQAGKSIFFKLFPL